MLKLPRSAIDFLCSIEQTRTMACRNRIEHLRHQVHDLELVKRYAQHQIQSEKHTNLSLEHQRTRLENSRLKFRHRLENLTEQTSKLLQKSHINERILSENAIDHEDQQSKLIALEITVKKLIDFNNELEKHLQQSRSVHRNEKEKLHSIKQISFEKRKQLLTHRKRLHSLSIDQHHFIQQTIRNTCEIVRLNNLLHHTNNTEQVKTREETFLLQMMIGRV